MLFSKRIFMYILIILFILLLILGLILLFKNQDKFSNLSDPMNIFWTGGYDSTFRICELLIIHKLPVQPIYISYNIDNKKKPIWSRRRWFQRESHKYELNAMNNIRENLYRKFPQTKDLLKETIVIDKDILDKNYNMMFDKLNLWPNKRKIHQYRHLGKISFLMKKHIDIGVLGLHDQPFIKFVEKNNYRDSKGLNIKLDLPYSHPLYYLKFPLFNKTKEELCNIAKKYHFDDILQISWSCWFPINGQPCGKCSMCLERYNCS